MSKATSSTRSVMITRSLCPRISWACCASCTLMVLSSLKIEPLGREHSNITSWSENTFRPNSQSTPKKLSFWDLCRANGEFYGTFHGHNKIAMAICPHFLDHHIRNIQGNLKGLVHGLTLFQHVET